MQPVAIRVEGLSKQYHIGGPQKKYNRIGYQLTDAVKAPFKRIGMLLKGNTSGVAGLEETIWALEDISFTVDHGEVIGIIGRNGAGKSTLLKILSRITEPTKGSADIYGRIGSLLEVGTGFHPELTGRENIYLNGAILGMTKAEIESKYDEIVAFSEIEKFINTPVKHYSSGMYVRLAFSVAAHLDPEILVVDEVLAVGDVAFQKKCLGKMGDVAKRGRTVLFVSHNMAVIQTLCQRGIYLDQGKITADGPIGDIVAAYLNSLEHVTTQKLTERNDRIGRGKIRLIDVQVVNGDSLPTQLVRTGDPVKLIFDLNGKLANLSCGFTIVDEIGQPIVMFKSDQPGEEDRSVSSDGVRFICEFDELMLLPGRYRVDVFIRGGGERQDIIEAAAYFDVETGQLRGRPMVRDNQRISTTFPHRWINPE